MLRHPRFVPAHFHVGVAAALYSLFGVERVMKSFLEWSERSFRGREGEE